MTRKRGVLRATVVALLFVATCASCAGAPPASVTGRSGSLAPCPNTPNCVSTEATDGVHRIEPLAFIGNGEETMAALVTVVGQMVRTTIIEQTTDYLHVEYRTRLGFVDDVEFLLDGDAREVRFRSASRVGTSDLGVNRDRMEEFRTLYEGLM